MSCQEQDDVVCGVADFVGAVLLHGAHPALPSAPSIPVRTVDLRTFGAVGDGRTLCTSAFRAAIMALDAAGGGRLLIPDGQWLTGAIHLRSCIELHLAEGACVRFSQDPADYLPVVLGQRGGIPCWNYSAFLYASGCHDIAITGPGSFDGQGSAWWPWKGHQPGQVELNRMCDECVPVDQRVFGTVEAGVRPEFLTFLDCDRVCIDGPVFTNSPSWSLHPVRCRDVTIRNVRIRNPPMAHNTDGINPDACRRVLIEHCHVDTGDDGICLKSGRNADGIDAGIPCEDVWVRNCTVLAAHGGIVIGSEVGGGIRRVLVEDCTFDGTNVGIRVKSRPGRGGFIRGVVMLRLVLCAIRHEAVIVTQFYSGNPDEPRTLDPRLPVTEMDGIAVVDMECAAAGRAMVLEGLPGHPLRRIALQRVSITARSGLEMRHVEDLRAENLQISTRIAMES